MAIIPKTPEEIIVSLKEMEVTIPDGTLKDCVVYHESTKEWLRSAMQSLLEQVIEEMPEEERSCTDSYCKGCERSSAPDRNAMRSACIAAIKSLQERI